jgi:hypothetical protein
MKSWDFNEVLVNILSEKNKNNAGTQIAHKIIMISNTFQILRSQQ